MSYNFYSLFHLSSLLSLCLILGALWGLYIQQPPNAQLKKYLLALHGLILFFIFLAGFGLIAKIKLPFPWPMWIYGKLLIWLLLGATPFFIRKASQRLRNKAPLYFLVLLCILVLFLLALFLVKLSH